MLGVEAWTTIRYLNAQGVGIRAICRQLGVSRTAVRHALRSEGRPHYQRPDRPNPQLLPYAAQIHTWYFGQHLIGSRILVLTPHPGRVRAELDADGFGFDSLDRVEFGAMSKRIHRLLFEPIPEAAGPAARPGSAGMSGASVQ